MGQNTIKKRTIGLIVFVVLIALTVGIFAAIAALQWWVAMISVLAVPVVIAVGMVAAIVGYQNFNTQIQGLRTQLRLAQEEIRKLEETIRRLRAPPPKTRPFRRDSGRANRKIESTYSKTPTDGTHLSE
jgi:predicted RND superfamily exporter protein